MKGPRHLESSCVVVLLLVLVSGCANVRDPATAITNPSTPHAQNADRMLADKQVSPVDTPGGLSVDPVSYTLGTEQAASEQPFDFMASDTVDSRPVLTLAEIEQFALANNPSIAAANAAASKAAGLLNQVGVRPNPIFGYFGQQIADANTDQHGVFLEQEIVRGSKLELNRRVLRHTTSAQRWEAEVQRYRVLTDVRVRFFEAAAVQRQVEATTEFAGVASRGVQVAVDRWEAEEGSKVDVMQAKILLSEINLARQQYEAAYRGAWKEMAAIAGMPASRPVQLAGSFTTPDVAPNWESTYDELIAQSPEVAVANELVCEKQANLKRQKAQPTPNLNAQIGTGYDNGTGSGLINLQVAAPIPILNRNSGNISAAYADYARAVSNVNRIKLEIRARLARVAQKYESATASVQRYEQEILPQAKESLSLSEEAYAAGELEFLQVLIVRRRYFDSMISFIQAQAHLSQANARLEGLLLTGGLDAPQDYTSGDGLRGQSFGGQ